MDSYDILVIILSVALGLSLIVWVFVGVLTIQVLKKIRAASDSAQEAADNVAAFTSGLKNAGKASAFGSVIKQAAQAFKNKK